MLTQLKEFSAVDVEGGGSVEFGGDFLESLLVQRRAGVRGKGAEGNGPPPGEGARSSFLAFCFPEGFLGLSGGGNEKLGLEKIVAEL